MAAFIGEHGWGYDSVAWFAPHEAYGGPDGLKRFVDAAHGRGLGVVLDVVSLSTDNAALAEASRWLIGIGIVTALLAAVFGLLDLSTIPRGTRAFRTGSVQAVLNVTAVLLFAVSLWTRAGEDGVPTSGLVLSVIGVAILGASGWLGGELAYHYGVRVADEETQAHGFH